MTNAIFTALEQSITELGTKSDGSVDLSELSLIGEGDERSIGFSLLGSTFLLTPSGEVVSIDGAEDNPETFALVEDVKRATYVFLKWRLAFIKQFGL